MKTRMSANHEHLCCRFLFENMDDPYKRMLKAPSSYKVSYKLQALQVSYKRYWYNSLSSPADTATKNPIMRYLGLKQVNAPLSMTTQIRH